MISDPDKSTQVFPHSSDSFCITLFSVLLQFCVPFFDLNDGKLKKISKYFMIYDKNMKELLSEPICLTTKKKNIEIIEEPGTITEFYYYTVIMFHFS